MTDKIDEMTDKIKGVEIKLQRNKDCLMDGWNIANIIRSISNSYYKSEVLNSIVDALNEGIEPKNIFILDYPFNYKNSNSHIGELKLDDKNDVQVVYHIGKPISMFPNEKIWFINFVFSYFRLCRETLNRYGINNLNKDILVELIKETKDHSCFIMAMNNIKNMSLMKIEEHELKLKTKNKKNSIDFEKVKEEIKDSYSSIMKECNKYLKSKTYFNKIEETISLEGTREIVKDKNVGLKNAYRSYFNLFFQILKDNIRPVVGIYDCEKNSFKILCSFHINRTEDNKRKLHFKNFKQNSPVEIIIAGSLILGLLLVATKVAQIKNKQIEVIEDETKQIIGQELKEEKKLELKLEQLTMNQYLDKRLDNGQFKTSTCADKVKNKENENMEKFNLEDSFIKQLEKDLEVQKENLNNKISKIKQCNIREALEEINIINIESLGEALDYNGFYVNFKESDVV